MLKKGKLICNDYIQLIKTQYKVFHNVFKSMLISVTLGQMPSFTKIPHHEKPPLHLSKQHCDVTLRTRYKQDSGQGKATKINNLHQVHVVTSRHGLVSTALVPVTSVLISLRYCYGSLLGTKQGIATNGEVHRLQTTKMGLGWGWGEVVEFQHIVGKT